MMKKVLNILGWIGVSLTFLALLLTMLSTYHFVYIEHFYGYYTLQWCLFFTLIIWGVKIFSLKSSIRDIVYTGICFLMAFGSMFFRVMKVQ